MLLSLFIGRLRSSEERVSSFCGSHQFFGKPQDSFTTSCPRTSIHRLTHVPQPWNFLYGHRPNLVWRTWNFGCIRFHSEETDHRAKTLSSIGVDFFAARSSSARMQIRISRNELRNASRGNLTTRWQIRALVSYSMKERRDCRSGSLTFELSTFSRFSCDQVSLPTYMAEDF